MRTFFVFFLKKIFFKFYLRLRVVGDIKKILEEHPKLLLISNHSSHLDAVAITSMMPLFRCHDLYITAAKDYFFSNPFIRFFSKHFLKAVPVDRSDEGGSDTFRLCVSLLQKLDKVWLLIFPEGTRSLDGKLQQFKRGVDVIAKKTNTPVLFLFIEGAYELWPKNCWFSKFGGTVTVYIGSVLNIEDQDIYENYREWVNTIKG